jgi:hypothetical protein
MAYMIKKGGHTLQVSGLGGLGYLPDFLYKPEYRDLLDMIRIVQSYGHEPGKSSLADMLVDSATNLKPLSSTDLEMWKRVSEAGHVGYFGERWNNKIEETRRNVYGSLPQASKMLPLFSTVVGPYRMQPTSMRFSGVGRTGDSANPAATAITAIGWAGSLAGMASGAYHGYRRNKSVGWGIGWGLLGGLFWPITIPVSLAQGFGEPKLASNPAPKVQLKK